jgi:hypothetical protein
MFRSSLQFFYRSFIKSTWVIHESRLPQMRGAGDEAVIIHCESAATKQMRGDRLACKVKSAAGKISF